MNKDDQNLNLNKSTSRTNLKNISTSVISSEITKHQKINSKSKKNSTNSNNSLKLAAATSVTPSISNIASISNQENQNSAVVTTSSSKKSSKQGNAATGRQNNLSTPAYTTPSVSSLSATSNTSDATIAITTSLSAGNLVKSDSFVESAAAINLANSARLKNNTNNSQNNTKIKLKVNNRNTNNSIDTATTTNISVNQGSNISPSSTGNSANGNRNSKNLAASTTTIASVSTESTVSLTSKVKKFDIGMDVDMTSSKTVPPSSTAVTSTATGTVPTITSSKSIANAGVGISLKSKKSSSTTAAAALALQQQAAAVSGKSVLSTTSAKSGTSRDGHLKFTSALPLLVGSAAAAAAAAKGAGSSSSASAQAAAAAAAAAALKQKLKSAAAASSVVAAAAANNSRSNSTSTSSNSSSLSSSVGIVNAISNALQNIITSDNSDTDTELYPPPVTDLSESDEESVSEILLACLCLRPDLLDDIPESDPDSCGHDAEGHEEEDDGDDEEEDEDEEDEEDEDDENEEDEEDDDDDDEEDEEEEIDDEDDDEEIQDPNEVSGDFLLDSNNDRNNRNINALFEAAANEKAPVLRHATHAIDETKQALTKMRGASSDKTMFSRTLIAACNDNDVNTVRTLLGKGNVNINESTDDGESLLAMACSAGYYELAQVLLAMSAAQVEDKGQKDCTPLMEAASAGHLDIVQLLISHKADVNAHCATGTTPLMFACLGGHVEVVKELLKHGANVEEQNENGHTPLMEAASNGHVEVAKVLLEHGAGINTHSNEFKESALTLACYKGHLNMVRFLLQAGADQEHKTDEMHTALMEASMDGHVEVARLLLDSGAQVNMPTDSFESPLTLAACGGHVELATLLIERGANIEEVNDEGYTPLMEAAREGHEEMVALLLSKGANINATTEETQETALTLACCGGFSEVAEYLIKNGANLELGASTPLMEAAQEGHTDLVRFLLENKANVHAETQTGDTALTHACENGHTDAAEVLLSYGAELEHESEGGRTPLMKACRAGHLCTVKFLISKGADVNKQTSSNDHTPLSLACAGGHQAVVEYLLKSGADPFHKLKDNSTMLIEAAKGGHTRVVELLFKYPHFIQNHQNEMQSAAAAVAAAAAVGINNTTASSAAANQLHLINLQQQKQMQQQQKELHQQLQLQLKQLGAPPPGLHEVSDAARATNQQIFHHQQFTTNNAALTGPTNEYLEEQLQLQTSNIAAVEDGSNQVVACNEEYAAININSLSAQQEEALIAKSRLFHLQAGFGNVSSGAGGVIANNNEPISANLNNQQQLLPQQLQHRKNFDLDMSHIMPLTPPQKQPPAPPLMQAQQQAAQLPALSQLPALTQQPQQQTSQQQPQPHTQSQQQIKVKSNQRKNRQQPPQPFEVSTPNTANSSNNNSFPNSEQQPQMQEIERSQPLGDDGLGNKPQIQQQSATQQQQLQFSCFNDDSPFFRRRIDFNKLTNTQKDIASALLPASYLNINSGTINQNQNVGDGADALTLNQNLLAVAPAIGDGSEMQPVIIASPEPLNFAPNQALMMQELFDPNNPQSPLTLATTLPQGTQFVLGPAPTQQQQVHQAQPQLQQQPQRIASGKMTQKTGGITTPSEVSQSTAISDRPKAKPVSKKDGKILRKTTTQSTAVAPLQQPIFRQNQMVSIYNNLPMLITNEATPSLQTQQAIMNHMVFAAQQHQQQQQQQQQHQQQQQITMEVVSNAQVSQQSQQQGIIALSNSPASPLASPSSGATSLYDPQQNQLVDISSTDHLQQQQQSENEQSAQEIQDALDAALSDSKLAVTDSLNALSKANAAAAAAAVAKACGLNSAEQQECLKKLQEGWRIVDLRQRIFHKQPKSPTETPPEKQIIDINNIKKELDGNEGDTNNEMKNLATLCTAAVQAAAVNVTVGEINQKDTKPLIESKSCNSGQTKKQRKLSKKEKSTQQETLELCQLPESLKDEINEECRNSVIDGHQCLVSEEYNGEDENNSDMDHQNDDANKCLQEFNEAQLLKSPTKGIKPISQRLENLILSNAPLKPVDLSRAFTDLRQEIGADVLTVFPQNMNLKFTGNTALSNALQQHLAAVKPQLGDVTEDINDGLIQPCDNESTAGQSNELVYPSSMDTETLEQFASAAGQSTNNNDNNAVVAVNSESGHAQVNASVEHSEEGIREEIYDIEVEMDEFFHVIHNANDPVLQELASNLNCSELADFGINSICKTRWNTNWGLTPKWPSQDQLISAAAAAHHQQQGLLPTTEEQQQQQEQQRHANQLLLDYQLQQQLQQRFADADEMQMQQHQHQQTTLSLLPFSHEDAAGAVQQQQQQLHSLPTSSSAATSVIEYQLPQQPQHHGLDQELKQHIQQLHQQQQTNVRLLKAVAAAAANQQQQQQNTNQPQQQNMTNNNNNSNNFVFNVDGCGAVGNAVADKSSQSLQLLFQLPTTAQQAQQQQHDDVTATAQQLQHLKLHHQELQDQQKQQQQQLKLLQQQEQDLSQATAESLMQQQQQQQTTLEQVAQNNLLLQQQAALAQQVLNQQVLKQKQQQLLLQQSTQVQVSTQTQPSVVVPHPNALQTQTSRGVNNQFCPSLSTMAASVDVGLGNVCGLTPQQQQLQQQHQRQQQYEITKEQMLAAGYAAGVLAASQHHINTDTTASAVLPAQASTSSAGSKMPGGIAKKVIDKQSRKERNRYSLLRSAAGSQGANAVAQQQYHQTVSATTALDKTIDVDSETDSNHDTALTLACAGGHEELVDLLINRGANIEHRDKKGFTPLILAATAGHEKVVDILLKHGADLEAQSERTKDTPLSLACSGGRYEVVELLLGIGANKEHRNVSDYTPLSLAASGGYVNIIKLLLNNGAEINSRTGSKLGISPLMLAAMNGHTGAVKLLLDQGSDINAQIETNRNTALTLACFQGRHEVVSLLLDRKANVEHRAKTGLTPLMEAASGGYIEVGRVLLDKGADVNAAPVPTSRDTALTIAADKGHLKFVELLLARGAAVEVKNKKGNSPLWLAAHGGHLSVVDILYNHNADIDSQDNRRVSCLMAAFRKGHTKTVRWMVQYVTQFPSDQEMNRFISTISDKELSEKCYDCMKIIRAAKEAQAVKANKNASILLEELDMERTREESRRAAAARRRERKKKKKMEKKEEKRRQMEEATGCAGNQQDEDDKDSDKDEESDHEDNNAAEEDDEQQNPQNYREEGDSGIDQGSCSSADIKASAVNVQSNDKSMGGTSKNKNKKKNKQQTTRSSSPVAEEILPAPVISAPKQQNKKKDDSTNSKSVSNVNKKVVVEQNTLAAKTPTNTHTNTNTSNKKSDQQLKKDDGMNNNHKKKESNKQKEKENLAPKELNAVGAAHQQQQQPTQTNSHSHNHNNKQQGHVQHNNHPQMSNNKSETIAVVNRKSLIFSASKASEETNKRDIESLTSTTLISSTAGHKSHSTGPAPKRGEDGWKEVVRKSSTQQSTTIATSSSVINNPSTGTAVNNKESSFSILTALSCSSNSSSSTIINVPGVSTTTTVTSTAPEMTCKKVQVPVNAISRVIGRAGSNINAIRATTGAHIEVEKQGKNQSERSITIKGLTEATKQAHMLILALIKDPDVDILQMLPRINTTIKASVVPPTSTTPPSSISTMQVGTWDNKTALQSACSNMSSGSSTTSSASSTPGSSMTSKTTANMKSNAKSQGAIGSNTTKSAIGRTQPSKPFYAQQTLTSSRGTSVGGASNTCNQNKHKDPNNKNLGGPTINQKSGTATCSKSVSSNFGGSGINSQTFAAKLLTGSSANSSLNSSNLSPTKKSELGLQRSGITAPYGRGKAIASSIINSLGSVAVLGQNNNTLSGPIGTFNVAEAAAAVAAANAAAAQAATSHNNPRSVTPIGPPNKQRASTPTQQSVGHNTNINASLQSTSHSLQQQQNLLLNTAKNGDNCNASGGATTMPPPSNFGSQLAAKIGSEYSLFNDYHQSQWGNVDNCQIYTNPNTLVNDNLPQADASKAPGYNRNVLSSPVGSSKASTSGTPPGNIAANINVSSQQTLTGLPETNVASIGTAPSQAARSPATISLSGNDLMPPSTVNAGQVSQQQQETSAISPNVIKPPGAIGQTSNPTCLSSQQQNTGNVTQPPPSGLAIQRPSTSGQHRANSSNNPTQQSPASAQSNVAENSTSALNFGPIGSSNNVNRINNPAGTIGEQTRFYDPSNQINVAAQMGYQLDPSLMQPPSYNSANSRLNPRASVFAGQQQQGNKLQQSQSSQGMASTMYHHQQSQHQVPPTQQNQPHGNVFNPAPGKTINSVQNLTPQRPQSQPQAGQAQSQRWYGSEYSTPGSYVPPSTRDILNLENGSAGVLGGAGTNSPAAMSPSQTSNVNINNPSANLLQTPPQITGQQSADDMRKIPRPIGTERASWKYNNYPGMANIGMGVGGLTSAVGLATMDDNLAAMTAAGIPGTGMPTGPLPPWLLGSVDKQAAAVAAQQQQQQQQHTSWMKQQYRYYNQGATGTGAIGGLTGIGGPADYHHQQDQFHMPLDYHNTMPPPNLSQNQPMNLIPTYTTYPHFLGHVSGNDMSHMPDKIELWDHHDKHTWTSNWSN